MFDNKSLGLSDEVFLNCFISGLNPDIRRDVVAMCPPTLLRQLETPLGMFVRELGQSINVLSLP